MGIADLFRNKEKRKLDNVEIDAYVTDGGTYVVEYKTRGSVKWRGTGHKMSAAFKDLGEQGDSI